MLDWQEYFKPPFFADTFNPGMIWDADFEMVQFDEVKYSRSNDGSVLYFTAYGDKMSIDIRGWAMLTASRKLSTDDAAAVQDSLGQFITDSLIEAIKPK